MTALLLVLAMLQKENSGMSPEQFLRLEQSLLGEIEDQMFVYEGDYRWVGDPDLVDGETELRAKTVQGLYIARSDGAGLLDLFVNPLAKDQMMGRIVTVRLHGRGRRLSMSTDNKKGQVKDFETALVGILSGANSAHKFNYALILRSMKPEDYEGCAFEARPGEVVDGVPCLRVSYSLPAAPNPTLFRDSMWIDLERGGHPILHERRAPDGRLMMRARMELGEFDAQDGKRLWIPTSGVIEWFTWANNTFYRKPLIRETYKVVPGSVVLNQGLGDEWFSIEKDRTGRYSPGLLALNRRFDETKPRVVRTDYPSVQADLDKRLAEADAQKERLDASASAARTGNGTGIYTGLCVALGLALLASAYVLRRRYG